uniref:Uncharacterized protein n=1 Tax=Branchiostoma floridae TaxID=7739 RepID=C3Y5R0_BRAFL|eukprot:XP_002608297.1 hypothetical protein BRAFLDRAFT_89274 [Branchiostoma floridae]
MFKINLSGIFGVCKVIVPTLLTDSLFCLCLSCVQTPVRGLHCHSSNPLVIALIWTRAVMFQVVVWGPDVVLGPGKPVLKVAQNLARKFPKTEVVVWGPDVVLGPGKPVLKVAQNLARKFPKTEFYKFSSKAMVDVDVEFKKETGMDSRNASVPDVPYHYYGKSALECSMYTGKGGKTKHKFVQEKTIFGRWAKNYNFTFVHPEWPPIQRCDGLRSILQPCVLSTTAEGKVPEGEGQENTPSC